MKVLITGSTGLLGSEFIKFIKSKNVAYQTFDRLNIEKSLKLDFDSVVHFGGLTPVSVTPEGINPSEKQLYEANVAATKNLLLALSKTKSLKKFINIGSAAEYGNHNETITEETKENPVDYYGKTKLEQTKLIQAYSQKNKVKTFNLRLFNLIGKVGSKNVAGLKIPIDESLELQFLQPGKVKEITISNKKNVRDFVDVSDVNSAILASLEKNNGKMFEIVNVSSGIGTSLEKLTELFAEILSTEVKITETSLKYTTSVGSNRKAKELFGWEPKLNLKESIKKLLNK